MWFCPGAGVALAFRIDVTFFSRLEAKASLGRRPWASNELTPDGKIWATPMEDKSLGLQLPLIMEEGGGLSLGMLQGWGSRQAPLHLAAGSWDRGQEGPICRLLVLPATLSRLGSVKRMGTAVWPRSCRTEMGIGATSGRWESGLGGAFSFSLNGF